MPDPAPPRLPAGRRVADAGDAPTAEPRPRPRRRLTLGQRYLALLVAVLLVDLPLLLASPGWLGRGFSHRVLYPLAALGVAGWLAWSLVPARVRPCRGCGRWLALAADGERVLRTRPIRVSREVNELWLDPQSGRRVTRRVVATSGTRETVETAWRCRRCGERTTTRRTRDRA